MILHLEGLARWFWEAERNLWTHAARLVEEGQKEH